MKLKIIPLIFLLLSANVFAHRDDNKTIERLGISSKTTTASANTGYFGIKEALATNCKFSIIYFDVTSDAGKAAYSNILSAKTSGRKLSRIEYDQHSNDFCYLTLVEVND